jgi:hypothetical protein
MRPKKDGMFPRLEPALGPRWHGCRFTRRTRGTKKVSDQRRRAGSHFVGIEPIGVTSGRRRPRSQRVACGGFEKNKTAGRITRWRRPQGVRGG